MDDNNSKGRVDAFPVIPLSNGLFTIGVSRVSKTPLLRQVKTPRKCLTCVGLQNMIFTIALKNKL